MLKHIFAGLCGLNGRTFSLANSAQEGQTADGILGVETDAADKIVMELVLKEPLDQFQDVPVDTIINDARLRSEYEAVTCRKLAAALGVSEEAIIITDVREGILKTTFHVAGGTPGVPEPENFKKEFGNNFTDIRVAPLLLALKFNPNDLDVRGDKKFTGTPSTFQIGPPGNQMAYTQPPNGWTRYGLKVLGKYGCDTWLHPFRHSNNWYRVYHGTGDPNRSDAKGERASVPKSIHDTGLRIGRNNAHGRGVYWSPNFAIAEEYSVTHGCLTVKFADETVKTYICVMQCAVRPGGETRTPFPGYFFVANPTDIRAYGLLLKEKKWWWWW
jgi:hypothetical protein